MELASEPFRAAVSEMFDSAGSVVATIQIARHPFTDTLKQRAGVETLRVSQQSRDELPKKLAARLL
jgi:nucleoside-triphosphatase THEP1